MSMQDFVILDTLYSAGDDHCKKQEITDTDMRIMACTLHQNAAYLILNYAAQVLNGGHSQWIDNDYYRTEGEYLLRILDHINGVFCRKVTRLISKANGLHQIDDIVDEDEWEGISDDLDKLDTEFYSYSDEFLLEVETWTQTSIVHAVS